MHKIWHAKDAHKDVKAETMEVDSTLARMGVFWLLFLTLGHYSE